MKNLITILIIVAIVSSVDLYWVFEDYPWKYIFLIGYMAIGWYVTKARDLD